MKKGTTSLIKAYIQERLRNEGRRDGGLEQQAAAAALVTPLVTELACSALPCHGKLNSTRYEYSTVVKVTSVLDWRKINHRIQKMSFQIPASTGCSPPLQK